MKDKNQFVYGVKEICERQGLQLNTDYILGIAGRFEKINSEFITIKFKENVNEDVKKELIKIEWTLTERYS